MVRYGPAAMSFSGRDSRAIRRLLPAAVALAIGAAGIGCGEKEEPEVTTPSVSVPTTPTAPVTPTATAPETRTKPAP
jgi:hypothetical protein